MGSLGFQVPAFGFCDLSMVGFNAGPEFST